MYVWLLTCICFFFASAFRPVWPGRCIVLSLSLCTTSDSRPGPGGSRNCCAMSIKGEVRVRKMHWLPLASFNQGRYVIRPFECTVTGKDDGYARVKASIHVHLTTFDEEEWSIITLVVAHLDSSFMYTDLFGPNCSPFGEFTDIKMMGNGYVVPKDMREYNFPVRNFDGTFYAQVYPFDPFHFSTKVHPGHSSSPHTTHSLRCCNTSFSMLNLRKSLWHFSPRYPNTVQPLMGTKANTQTQKPPNTLE